MIHQLPPKLSRSPSRWCIRSAHFAEYFVEPDRWEVWPFEARKLKLARRNSAYLPAERQLRKAPARTGFVRFRAV